MESFDDPMDIEVLLGDLGSPISFISWEEDVDALLDNLPPESPKSTPESPPNSPHNPDHVEALTNLNLNVSDKEVTTPAQFQSPNQPNAHISSLMSLNIEKVQPINRSFIIPKESAGTSEDTPVSYKSAGD
ncbi:unnamed protein product, partial [Allacma fusca]